MVVSAVLWAAQMSAPGGVDGTKPPQRAIAADKTRRLLPRS